MTTGEELFWQNAAGVLRDIGMDHLDPAHGATVDIVRWCRVVGSRPTHHRQQFLEVQAPALLAYLEALASSDEAGVWRTLEERILLRAEILRAKDTQLCARPWLAAIWHTLPELSAIGQRIIDLQAEANDPNPDETPTVLVNQGEGKGSDDGEGGSGDKSGSAGTTAKPQPQPSTRLTFPATPVRLSAAERKVFGLDDDADNDDGSIPNGTDGPDGTKGPVDPKGGKK